MVIISKQNKLIDIFELKKGENIIIISINKNLINFSYMFFGCKTLKDISDLKYLEIKDTKDISHIFFGCSSLSDIFSLKNWKVSNVINFSYIFNGCSSLSNIKPLEI